MIIIALKGHRLTHIPHPSHKISDIIVMPSQWEEPFGRVAAEAGAASKPIVASNIGGIPEIIEHGKNGFLVEKGDLDSLVKFVKKLIKNKRLREKMGKKGREIIGKKFSNEMHVKKIEKIYEGLL